VKFKVRKEPFGPRYRSRVFSPFGLSLSKPIARGTKASASSAWPFDKLRANGGGKPTVVNVCNGPFASLRGADLAVPYAVSAGIRDASPERTFPTGTGT
jgi:hypothetical protein